MRVHGEPLLQFRNFRDGIDKRPVAFSPFVAAAEGVGQIQAARIQRRALAVHRLVRILHRRNVVAHVHDGVRGEHRVGVHHRQQQVALRIHRRGRTVLVHLRHLGIVNVEVLRRRRRAWLRRVGAVVDRVVGLYRVVVVVVAAALAKVLCALALVLAVLGAALAAAIVGLLLVVALAAAAPHRTLQFVVLQLDARLALDVGRR
jgi:hypothetical protein